MTIELSRTLDPQKNPLLLHLLEADLGIPLELPVDPTNSGFAHHASRAVESKEHDLNFAAVETWQVMLDGSKAKKSFVVGYQSKVSVVATAHLFVDQHLPAPVAEQIRTVFYEYNAAIHGTDIDAFAANRLAGVATSADYWVTSSLTVEKITPTRTIESRTRDEFLEHAKKGWSNIRFDELPNTDGEIIDPNRIKLLGPEYSELSPSGEVSVEPATEVSQSTPNGPNPNPADIIDTVIGQSGLFPPECGNMNAVKSRFARLPALPETKVEIRSSDIEIGCVVITIYYPVLLFRTVEFEAWYHYRVPANLSHFLAKNAEICAKRASLTAAVVGFLFWNPAPAAAAFSASFKSCWSSVILTCADASITVVKTVGEWN